MKNEADVIDATEPAMSVDLPDEASTSVKALMNLMYPNCSLQNVDFGELKKLQELEYEQSIGESPVFVLPPPQYNINAVAKTITQSTTGSQLSSLTLLCACVALF